MASGHVNRTQRPNTWLHRPSLQNAKIPLANSEPSTHGTKRTSPGVCTMSAFGGEADIAKHSAMSVPDPGCVKTQKIEKSRE
jgi:hypothetical protein